MADDPIAQEEAETLAEATDPEPAAPGVVFGLLDLRVVKNPPPGQFWVYSAAHGPRAVSQEEWETIKAAEDAGKPLVEAEEVDIDAAPPKAPEREIEAIVEESDDPLLLEPGFVPIYNGTDEGIVLPGAGEFYTIGPKKVKFVSTIAAERAVGADNIGGPLVKAGVVRLYGPESRFVDAAKAQGLDLVGWAKQRNLGLIYKAENAAKAFAKAIEKNPDAPEIVALRRALGDDRSSHIR